MEITKTEDRTNDAEAMGGNEQASSATVPATGDKTDAGKEYVPLENLKTAKTDSAKGNEPMLEAVDSSEEDRKGVIGYQEHDVYEITDEEKAQFIRAVVTGDRYRATARLFGGNMVVKFRSRSVDETEAILSYLHRKGILGEFSTRSDMSNATVAALLTAQVEEIDGVAYPEMKRPLKFSQNGGTVEDPAWVSDADGWRRKPEFIVSALGRALIEFESKYWAMIDESKNENFWNPGTSTGK